MSNSDNLSAKIQNERHLQTMLLTLITLGITLAIAMLMFLHAQQTKLMDEQKIDGRHIVAISTNQVAMRDRIDELAQDRYTASQATSDNKAIFREIGILTETVAGIDDRLRKVEQKVD